VSENLPRCRDVPPLSDESSYRTRSRRRQPTASENSPRSFLRLQGMSGEWFHNSSPPVSFHGQGGPPSLELIISSLMEVYINIHLLYMVTKNLLSLTLTTIHRSSIMWKVTLFVLYAARLFALVSAYPGIPTPNFPLNTCILTVQSTGGNITDPRSSVTYGTPRLSRSS
jgi:hypothetical protein